MPEDIIVRCCAPTLAAIKTGSLFNYAFESSEDLTGSLRSINNGLRQKGICVIPVRIRENRALLYLFRPAMLAQDLQDPLAERILTACGYPQGKVTGRIACLMQRLRETGDFPHEIGLFLGYPPLDVQGFIEKKPCKCTGVWKVFESNVADARRYFARCKSCTRTYLRRNQNGWSLSRLAVQP